MRVLVIDEALALGGVDRLWTSLMPELGRRCDHLVWMIPHHRLADVTNAIPGEAKIVFETFHWPTWNWPKIVAAIKRRMAQAVSRVRPSAAVTLERTMQRDRIRQVAKAHHITHLLYPALFTQAFPGNLLPVYAVVMDVNYHASIRTECRANLVGWATQGAKLITISDFTREEVKKLLPSSADIKSIPIATSKPPVTVPKHQAQGTRRILYFPAAFHPHKRHGLLLDAAKFLFQEGAAFDIVFSGSGTEELLACTPLAGGREYARGVLAGASPEFRNRVHVKGMVDRDEVERYYAAADLVVLPTSYEGFGLPLAEAVARGKHVLCSDIPPFREQIRRYGFDRAVTLVDSNNNIEWARAIQAALIKRQAAYSDIELQTIFARWTWGDVAEEYIDTLAAGAV